MRLTAARVLALVSALFWLLPFFGVIDLATVFLNRGWEWRDGYVLDGSWGVLFTVLVTVPLAVLARRPGDPVATAVLGVTSVALLLGAAWAAALPQLWVGLALAADAAATAALGGVRRPPTRRPDRPLLGLAVVVLAGALAAGRDVLAHPTVLDSVTNGVDHHGVQAALGLALAGCLALAAVVPDRLPAWCVVGSLLWMGMVSLVYPGADGSLGTVGGAAALVVAAAVALAVVGRTATRTDLRTRRAAAR